MNHDLSVHNKRQHTNLGIYFIHHLLCTNDYTEDGGDLRNLQKFLVLHSSEVYYSVLRGAKWKALIGSHGKASNPKVRATDLIAIVVYATFSVH